ncbi:MAG: DUF1566 domain-containing protein [Betaproteobacteria bacterium]|nr:MAG: DUF1566 domain-containing protein [Betaproteobacteria bacterium]
MAKRTATRKKPHGSRAKRVTAPKFTPGLSRPTLKDGEEYIGAIVGADGKGHHVILLPGDEAGTHADMMASAKKRGGDLPDRVEQALLFRDHRDKFQRDWYWSNTQRAGGSDYAWCQGFGYGGQDWHYVSHRFRARAVRRIPIR